jgi:hypothetical protein
MPIPPDPTHPKFLEGDEVLRPSSAQDDDVEGHIMARATDEPGTEPEGMKTRVTEEAGDDVEGHFRAMPNSPAGEGEGVTDDEGTDDAQGLHRL